MMLGLFVLICGLLATLLYRYDWLWYTGYNTLITVACTSTISYRLTELCMHADLTNLTCDVKYVNKLRRSIAFVSWLVIAVAMPALLLGFPALPEGLLGVFQ